MTELKRRELLKEMGVELHNALKARKTINPLSKRGFNLTIEDAYEIQTYMLEQRISKGIRVIGKKIGATSKPVQEIVGIDQPDFGLLLDDSEYKCGAKVPYDHLIQPRAEGEIAFYLKKELKGPGVTPEDVLDATDYIVPCIEIVDSRISNWDINIVDTIADNASCGVFVLGDAQPYINDLNLSKCVMQMWVNGVLMTQGLGSASLGHPAIAVAWLANKFGEMGEVIKAGEPILSGSLGELVTLQKGDTIELEISDVGKCNVHFV